MAVAFPHRDPIRNTFVSGPEVRLFGSLGPPPGRGPWPATHPRTESCSKKSSPWVVIVPNKWQTDPMKLTTSEMKLAVSRQGQDFRPCDTAELMSQIGRMNVFAVSGGRVVAIENSQGQRVGVLLPCGKSRAVEVVLDWMDTYTVRRVRMVTSGANRGTVEVESETTGVYCDEIGEMVYQASCWR